MSLADDILLAAARPRRPEPGETVYVIRKTLARPDHIPTLATMISKCYTRRVQLNGVRVIVMGPEVEDFTGEGTFCTFSTYEFFLSYVDALEYAAGIIQNLIDGFDKQRKTADDVMAEIQRLLAKELYE